jgi:hemolysin activation/secretion protein
MGLREIRALIACAWKDNQAMNIGARAMWRCGRSNVAVVAASAASIFCFVSPVSVKAEQVVQPGFDPQQIERRFDESQTGLSARDRSTGLRMPTLSRPQARANSRPLFDLRSVRLTGAHAIPLDQIKRAYQPYLGKKVSEADLSAIAAAIGDVYREAGFHLSRAIIPPQDIRDGQVRVQVIEGSITEVALKGDGAEQFGIRTLLEPVLAESPSRLSTLERQLLLSSSRPGVRVEDTALEEIGNATGRFRLIVYLKTWHIYTWFGLDNLGYYAIGPWQTYATGAFNSYFLPGDMLALNLSTIANDPRELGFGRISYDVPVGSDGVRVGASVLYSEVRPGDIRRLFNDVTTTEAFEVRGSIVPLMSQKSAITLTVATDFSNVWERDVLGQIYDDHIRTVSLTSDYRLQDDIGGNNFLTLTFRQGLPIFGASQSGDIFVSRFGAAANFSVVDVWFTRYQTLFDAWSLKIAGAGQIASGPLFTSQQFYLGGAFFGRGYGSAEISGDNGMAGSLELRFDQSASFGYLTGYELFSFVDAGTAWNSGFNYNQGLALTSVGAGVRFFMGRDLQADIAVAFPLGYRAPENSMRTARLLFSLSSAFRACPERGQAYCL